MDKICQLVVSGYQVRFHESKGTNRFRVTVVHPSREVFSAVENSPDAAFDSVYEQVMVCPDCHETLQSPIECSSKDCGWTV